MKILVINCGSSSLKFKLFEEEKLLAQGHIDGINQNHCQFFFNTNLEQNVQKLFIKNHKDALKISLKTLLKSGRISSYKEISAVGHRIVHGGEKFVKSTKIDSGVIKEIKKLSSLAPLHNPVNLEGVLACQKLIKRTPQIAVFDTAFHQTMPEKAFIYGIPYDFYEKENIRRYGFHGTSHKFVIEKAIKILKKKNLKIISCHLGNGSSITASLNGKSIDTSMGFTPLEGIIMGTRSGNIDPAIIFHLEKKYSKESVEEILLKKSGILGLSKISSDMRKIYEKSLQKDKLANLTLEILSYQIAKYCGAYAAGLNGLDSLIFTGGIGENAFYIREKVCKYLEFLGAKLDKTKNTKNEELISNPKSKIKIFVIKTDEELQIARETAAIVLK